MRCIRELEEEHEMKEAQKTHNSFWKPGVEAHEVL